MQIFNYGDEPFLQWMHSNTEGFVLNATSGENSSYLLFHKSQCRHISGYTSTQSLGAFTERSYIKVCANEPSDLVSWARINRPKVMEYTACKTCVPEIEKYISALPEEIGIHPILTEGAVRTISVNAYERNVLARKACLEHYGPICVICEFDFSKTYGLQFEGFIHVHHLIPLHEIKGEYQVDPVKDLRPVCPNCHAVIHHGNETSSIAQVKQFLELQEGET